jgi:uncharacterized protein YbaP (TraB family)
MKNKIFLFLLSIIACNITQSQELEKSLLWEISGNGLEQPSYIYGTIHMTCDASLDDNILMALDNTSLLVLEIDMDDPNLQMNMMNGVYMKNGTTVKDLVSADDYLILDSFIKEQTGMSMDLMGNIKPFFLTAMLYPKLLDCTVQSFENELMKVALSQKEEILGLETIEEQLNVFEEIPYEDQIKDLLSSAKDNMAYDKESFLKMLEYYENKDLEGIQNLIKNDKNLTTTKHSDKLLTNRNKNWISKIESYSKGQPTFYGVGAGHLPGEFGIINLLKKNGYTVKAIL